MVCGVYRLPRATVYAQTAGDARVGVVDKRGPKTAASDAELVDAIRAVLAATPFHGVGALILRPLESRNPDSRSG